MKWFFVGLLSWVSLASAQDFTWRDVVQQVSVQADGSVVVRDERTLTTDEDFGEAYICIDHTAEQTVTLLEGGVLSPGPAARAFQQPCEDNPNGTELVVQQATRVSERRVFYRYRLEGSLDVYSDVVQWYWHILESVHPPVRGYELTVQIPAPMSDPYDAYVHRLGDTELPTVNLSEDRQTLEVHYNYVPADTGVEIRYFMPPQLFSVKGKQPGFERLLRDETQVAELDKAKRNPLWGALALIPVIGLSFGVTWAARRYRPTAPAMQYPFEPPADRPPATVPYFASRFANSSSPAFHATIMDLARRGYGIFDSKSGKFNMQLLAKDDSDLLPFERDVLNYLKRAAKGDGRTGDPNYLEFRELKRYSERHLSSFMSGWWNGVGLWLSQKLGGTRLEPASQRAAGVWFALALLSTGGCVLGGILTLGTAQIVFFIGAVLCGSLGAAALFTIPAWRKEVAPEALGWQGFRRTLSDYTQMKRAPDDFFKLWEVYYCYAAALGVADKFLKNMQRAAPERGDGVGGRGLYAPLWLGNMSTGQLQSLGDVTSSLSSLSSALNAAGASASSGGSVAGGGGGGGGGSSGGR